MKVRVWHKQHLDMAYYYYFLATPRSLWDFSSPVNQGSNPDPPAVEAWSLNPWTAGEVLTWHIRHHCLKTCLPFPTHPFSPACPSPTLEFSLPSCSFPFWKICSFSVYQLSIIQNLLLLSYPEQFTFSASTPQTNPSPTFAEPKTH